MTLPAYGTAPIRCGKKKCAWRGYETEMRSVPHPTIKSATKTACPLCGCDSYMFMTEREIKAWKPVEQSSAPTGADKP